MTKAPFAPSHRQPTRLSLAEVLVPWGPKERTRWDADAAANAAKFATLASFETFSARPWQSCRRLTIPENAAYGNGTAATRRRYLHRHYFGSQFRMSPSRCRGAIRCADLGASYIGHEPIPGRRD
jgi:hypothetical protein